MKMQINFYASLKLSGTYNIISFASSKCYLLWQDVMCDNGVGYVLTDQYYVSSEMCLLQKA